MISYITNKEEITRKILPLIDSTEISDFDYAMKTWWVNIRSTGGLFLSSLGDEMFRLAQIEYHDLTADWGSMAAALKLDRKMPCPYYLYVNNKQKFIRVYDSRVAMLITLHGSIQNFLQNKSDIHYPWSEND